MQFTISTFYCSSPPHPTIEPNPVTQVKMPPIGRRAIPSRPNISMDLHFYSTLQFSVHSSSLSL